MKTTTKTTTTAAVAAKYIQNNAQKDEAEPFLEAEPNQSLKPKS